MNLALGVGLPFGNTLLAKVFDLFLSMLGRYTRHFVH